MNCVLVKQAFRFLFFFLCVVAQESQGLWNQQHEEGWHWYQDPVEAVDKQSDNKF